MLESSVPKPVALKGEQRRKPFSFEDLSPELQQELTKTREAVASVVPYRTITAVLTVRSDDVDVVLAQINDAIDAIEETIPSFGGGITVAVSATPDNADEIARVLDGAISRISSQFKTQEQAALNEDPGEEIV